VAQLARHVLRLDLLVRQLRTQVLHLALLAGHLLLHDVPGLEQVELLRAHGVEYLHGLPAVLARLLQRRRHPVELVRDLGRRLLRAGHLRTQVLHLADLVHLFLLQPVLGPEQVDLLDPLRVEALPQPLHLAHLLGQRALDPLELLHVAVLRALRVRQHLAQRLDLVDLALHLVLEPVAVLDQLELLRVHRRELLERLRPLPPLRLQLRAHRLQLPLQARLLRADLGRNLLQVLHLPHLGVKLGLERVRRLDHLELLRVHGHELLERAPALLHLLLQLRLDALQLLRRLGLLLLGRVQRRTQRLDLLDLAVHLVLQHVPRLDAVQVLRAHGVEPLAQVGLVLALRAQRVLRAAELVRQLVARLLRLAQLLAQLPGVPRVRVHPALERVAPLDVVEPVLVEPAVHLPVVLELLLQARLGLLQVPANRVAPALLLGELRLHVPQAVRPLLQLLLQRVLVLVQLQLLRVCALQLLERLAALLQLVRHGRPRPLEVLGEAVLLPLRVGQVRGEVLRLAHLGRHLVLQYVPRLDQVQLLPAHRRQRAERLPAPALLLLDLGVHGVQPARDVLLLLLRVAQRRLQVPRLPRLLRHAHLQVVLRAQQPDLLHPLRVERLPQLLLLGALRLQRLARLLQQAHRVLLLHLGAHQVRAQLPHLVLLLLHLLLQRVLGLEQADPLRLLGVQHLPQLARLLALPLQRGLDADQLARHPVLLLLGARQLRAQLLDLLGPRVHLVLERVLGLEQVQLLHLLRGEVRPALLAVRALALQLRPRLLQRLRDLALVVLRPVQVRAQLPQLPVALLHLVLQAVPRLEQLQLLHLFGGQQVPALLAPVLLLLERLLRPLQRRTQPVLLPSRPRQLLAQRPHVPVLPVQPRLQGVLVLEQLQLLHLLRVQVAPRVLPVGPHLVQRRQRRVQLTRRRLLLLLGPAQLHLHVAQRALPALQLLLQPVLVGQEVRLLDLLAVEVAPDLLGLRLRPLACGLGRLQRPRQAVLLTLRRVQPRAHLPHLPRPVRQLLLQRVPRLEQLQLLGVGHPEQPPQLLHLVLLPGQRALHLGEPLRDLVLRPLGPPQVLAQAARLRVLLRELLLQRVALLDQLELLRVERAQLLPRLRVGVARARRGLLPRQLRQLRPDVLQLPRHALPVPVRRLHPVPHLLHLPRPVVPLLGQIVHRLGQVELLVVHGLEALEHVRHLARVSHLGHVRPRLLQPARHVLLLPLGRAQPGPQVRHLVRLLALLPLERVDLPREPQVLRVDLLELPHHLRVVPRLGGVRHVRPRGLELLSHRLLLLLERREPAPQLLHVAALACPLPLEVLHLLGQALVLRVGGQQLPHGLLVRAGGALRLERLQLPPDALLLLLRVVQDAPQVVHLRGLELLLPLQVQQRLGQLLLLRVDRLELLEVLVRLSQLRRLLGRPRPHVRELPRHALPLGLRAREPLAHALQLRSPALPLLLQVPHAAVRAGALLVRVLQPPQRVLHLLLVLRGRHVAAHLLQLARNALPVPLGRLQPGAQALHLLVLLLLGPLQLLDVLRHAHLLGVGVLERLDGAGQHLARLLDLRDVGDELLERADLRERHAKLGAAVARALELRVDLLDGRRRGRQLLLQALLQRRQRGNLLLHLPELRGERPLLRLEARDVLLQVLELQLRIAHLPQPLLEVPHGRAQGLLLPGIALGRARPLQQVRLQHGHPVLEREVRVKHLPRDLVALAQHLVLLRIVLLHLALHLADLVPEAPDPLLQHGLLPGQVVDRPLVLVHDVLQVLDLGLGALLADRDHVQLCLHLKEVPLRVHRHLLGRRGLGGLLHLLHGPQLGPVRLLAQQPHTLLQRDVAPSQLLGLRLQKADALRELLGRRGVPREHGKNCFDHVRHHGHRRQVDAEHGLLLR